MNKNELSSLIFEATSADVISNTSCGFISVMSQKSKEVQRDIPAAFEMYSLLEFYSQSSNMVQADLFPGEHSGPTLVLEPSIVFDHAQDGTGRVVAFIPIQPGDLSLIAMWLSESLCSPHVQGLPGLLALPFTIERHNNQLMLLPSWFAAFYVDGSAETCVPILAMKSVLSHDQFGDWAQTALHGLSGFGMPTKHAMAAAAQVVPKLASTAHTH